MSAAVGFQSIKHIRFKFSPPTKLEYKPVHKDLDNYFSNGLNDVAALFTTDERTELKQNVIDIIRLQIATEMEESLNPSDHPQIHQIVQNMAMSI